jgi:uncharacterized protein YdcH (DUF465 family)
MIASQLERLKQDYNELDYYIQRLQKEGNTASINGMQRKQQYLKEVIDTLLIEEPEFQAA